MAHISSSRRKSRAGAITFFTLALVLLFVSACGGNPQAQQQADASKIAFNDEIAHAQSIGIPSPMLAPIMSQAVALSGTSAPFALFNDQPVTQYNQNLSQRYSMLTLEVKGLEAQATQQFDYQASQDLQTMENALAQRQSQKFVEARIFASQLTNYQAQLTRAQFPKDYLSISQKARSSTQALHLMMPAFNALNSLQQVIQQLQASHLDTTALGQQAQSDLAVFRTASSPVDYTQLIDQINTQLQETTVYSTQAIPYVGAAKIRQFASQINQLKQYGVNTASFQQKLTADQQALANAKSIRDYLKVSAQIDNDTASIQFPLAQGEATYLVKQ
ncbi:MAG TPA: hypothetical protein VKT25_10410, partial [Ktedonobacteraceae bacterium]|nr:hypothetical protein [Ktedonobacteraceae bacterium]